MKLSKKAIKRINNLDTRVDLAKGLRFSETWIHALIRKNKENGPLTTAKALHVIKENTGMAFEEILEDTNVIA